MSWFVCCVSYVFLLLCSVNSDVDYPPPGIVSNSSQEVEVCNLQHICK